MADPLSHRQTKEAATDMVDLTPPRHIPTLPPRVIAPLSSNDRIVLEPDRSPACRGTAGIGATLSPGRVPVKDCVAPIAVARCRASGSQAGAHARVRELATTKAMEPETGLVSAQFWLRCPTRMKAC